jgi:hypothetical protein
MVYCPAKMAGRYEKVRHIAIKYDYGKIYDKALQASGVKP